MFTPKVLEARRSLGLPDVPPPRKAAHGAELSASRLSVYQQCPRAFFYRYREGRRSPPNRAMLKGGLAHRVLEQLGLDRLGSELIPGVPTHADVEEAVRLATCSDDALRAEVEELLQACRGKVFLGDAVAVEEPFTLGVPVAGQDPAMVTGIWDRVDLVGDLVEIVDYKSGEVVPSRDELENDEQILCYLHAGSRVMRLGGRDLRIRLSYLARDVEVVIPWTERLDRRGGDLIAGAVSRIRHDDTYEASVGSHCTQCSYRYGCPAYGEVLRSTEHPLAVAAGSDAELLTRRARFSQLSAAYEAERKALDEVIRLKLEAGGPLEAGGFRARLATRTNRRTPALAVVAHALGQVIGVPGSDVAAAVGGVDEGRLREFLDRYPAEVRSESDRVLDGLKEYRSTSTFVEVRKNRAQGGEHGSTQEG